MALPRWCRFLFPAAPGKAEVQEMRDRQEKESQVIRHDFDNRLNKISVATHESRVRMDSIDAHVEYMRVTSRDERRKHDDDAGGGADPGVGERPGDPPVA